MSANFNGRRAPNVSQYLANLNPATGQQDISPAQADFDLGSDLDFLTNAEFFDFDSFHPQDMRAQDPHDSQFHMGQFQAYPGSVVPSPILTSPASGLPGAYPPQPGHGHPYRATDIAAGEKRKASAAASSPADIEGDSRVAAEEDKRRRNTAASARFRVKKKQREQALEKQAKEMTDKVSQLETKVRQLEMENKWLKELITEKSDARIFETAFSEKKTAHEDAQRSRENHTDGVGTGLKPEA